MLNISPTQLGLFLSLFLIGGGCNSQPSPKEVIEQQALDAIDFDELEPSIREFIELAQANKTIGRPITDFEELLENALSSDNLDDGTRLHSYQFLPAMTDELKSANSESNGVVYWPMLMIRVDKETQKIAFVFLILKGF